MFQHATLRNALRVLRLVQLTAVPVVCGLGVLSLCSWSVPIRASDDAYYYCKAENATAKTIYISNVFLGEFASGKQEEYVRQFGAYVTGDLGADIDSDGTFCPLGDPEGAVKTKRSEDLTFYRNLGFKITLVDWRP
jgi:hypothetical protein